VTTEQSASIMLLLCWGVGHAMRGPEASVSSSMETDRGISWVIEQQLELARNYARYHTDPWYLCGDIDRAVVIMDSDNSAAVSWKKAKIRFLQVVGLHVVCSLIKLTSHQHSDFPHLVLILCSLK
jgi:hypothetical protein